MTKKEKRIEIEATKTNCKIFITAYAFQKMRYLVENVDNEVAWLSTTKREGNTFTINEIYIPEQEVSASDVESSPEMMSSLIPEIIEKEGLEESKEIIRDLRGFCHSHYTMGVFWSQKDEDGIEGLGNSEFLVSLVLNRKGDILGRVDLFSPIRLTLNKVPIEIDYSSESDELDEDIKNKIKTRKFVPKVYTGGSNYGKGSNYGYGGRNYGRGTLWDEEDEDLEDNPAWGVKFITESGTPEVTSAFSLPSLLRNKHPELSDICTLASKSHGKNVVMRDLISLTVASNYENKTLLDRKEKIKLVLQEMIDKPHTDMASPEAVFEIINIAEMWGDSKTTLSVKPDKIMKVSSFAALYTLLQTTFKVNVKDTYCLKP